MKKILFLSLSFFLFSSVSKIMINNPISYNKERIIHYLSRLLDTKKSYPGLQYLVFNKEGIIFEYAGGFADVKNKIKMTSNHTMNVFSTTKLITAMAILQLSDKNKLDLNDKIEKYIPDIPYKDVTIRQVLSHSGGIPNPIMGNFYVHWSKDHNNFDRDKLLVNVMKAKKKLKFEPGTNFSYSNLGFAILGKIIEIVSGKKYEDYVTENIFDKLKLNKKEINFLDRSYSNSAKPYYMRHSFSFNILASLVIKGTVVKREDNYKTLENYWYFNFPSHGGIIASSKEYSKIFIDLLNEDSNILSRPMKELFFKEQFRIGKRNVAISWFIKDLNGIKYYYQQGGGIGYIAEIRIYKDDNIGTILLINQSDPSLLKNLNEIDSEFLK